MRLNDPEIISLVKAAAAEQHDCFITPDVFPTLGDLAELASKTRLKTAVIFPEKKPINISDAIKPDSGLSFYPGEVFSDPGFADEIIKKKFEEIVILNAELAVRTEYGSLLGYTRFSDLRASIPEYIHLTAVLSGEGCDADNGLLKIYGSEDAFVLGASENALTSELFKSDERKYNAVCDFAGENDAPLAVFCTTRREAETLSALFSKRSIPHVLFHGGLDNGYANNALNKAIRGRIHIIATKSLLSYSVFLPEYETVYCGMPYSVSHASRITSLTHSSVRKIKIFYCTDDVRLLMKITQAYAEEYTDNASEFINKRNDDLVYLLEKIIAASPFKK